MKNLKVRKEYGNLPDYVYDKVLTRRDMVYTSMFTKTGKERCKDVLPPPAADFIFKKMFTEEGTKKYACHLISLIFELDQKYLEENMILYRNELAKMNLLMKDRRVDFVGKCDDTFYVIEMNNDMTLERNEEYAHMLHACMCGKGGTDKYMNVVLLNLNNFVVHDVEKTISICARTDGIYRSSRITYVHACLPLMKRKYKSDGIESMNEAERIILAEFIARENDARRLAKGDELAMSFIDDLKSLKKNGRLMNRMRKYDGTMVANYEAGEEAGLEKGREEGREEANIENATKMLRKGMNYDTVREVTSLSLEKIKNIAMML